MHIRTWIGTVMLFNIKISSIYIFLVKSCVLTDTFCFRQKEELRYGASVLLQVWKKKWGGGQWRSYNLH